MLCYTSQECDSQLLGYELVMWSFCRLDETGSLSILRLSYTILISDFELFLVLSFVLKPAPVFRGGCFAFIL